MAITIKDFTQHFQKILIIDMNLDIGAKNLMSEEISSTIQNYYRRKKMSKSVLVIDTPENCLDCQFCYELDEGVEACC